MRTRISRARLYFLLLALCSALFPVLYFSIDPDILDITDKQNYESVFFGNINADTAYYPLFLATWLSVSSITASYESASLFFAIIFTSSSVLLFGWQLGKSFKLPALCTPILSTLVLFSFYTIKVSFALKKLALGLFFVNLSFLIDDLSLILLLRGAVVLVHPQLLPILFLPNSVNNLRGKRPFSLLSRMSSSLHIIKWKAIGWFALLFLSLAIVSLFVQNALADHGGTINLFIASLQYKLNHYLDESSLQSQLVLPLAVICFVLASILASWLILSNMQMTTKLYYISVSAYLISAMVFGTSRLFLLFPYLLYPLRSWAAARICLFIFFGYSCYRAVIVFSGAATFS